MALTVIGIAIIAVIGFWILGGIFLRAGGIVFAFAGVVALITLHDPVALFMLVLGFVMWLAGHWHFALRHHAYKSPLAHSASSCRYCRRGTTRRAAGVSR